MPQSVRHHALIAIVAVVVLFTNLGGPRLWDRDEPRNAGCAAEMLARGDWITPVFNGELRDHKPVLVYWLIIASYLVLGVSEFAARLPSAALALGTALITYHIGRHLFHARVGFWAAIILVTNLMFAVAGRAATPDSTLIFFTTLAIGIFVWGSFPAGGSASDSPPGMFPRSYFTALAMYAAMGLAVLAKGPVGLVIPTAVIGMFLLIQRLPADCEPLGLTWQDWMRWCLRPFAPGHFLRTCWAMRPITAIVACLAVSLPWYYSVGVRTDGEFLRGFFLQHNLGRAMQPMEGHSGSILFYPLALLIGFFPWSIFAVPTVLEITGRIRRADPRSAGLILAACWVGVYVGLFSLARTKLPSYVTPCYPALALLTGWYMDRWTRHAALAPNWWPRLALGCLGAVGAALLVALPLVAQHFLPGDEMLGVLGLIPVTGALVAYLWMRNERFLPAGLTLAGTAVLLTTALFGWASVRVDRHQLSHEMLSAIQQHSPEAEIGALGCLEPSWVFYGGQSIRELALPEHGVAEPTEPAENPWRRQPLVGVDHFLTADPDRVVITTEEHFARIQDTLPPDATVLTKIPRFLRDEQLIVIGRDPSAARTATTPGSSGRW